MEVELPEARRLGVPVHGAAADTRRQLVDVARERAVAVGHLGAEGAGLGEGVGAREVADGLLDLVAAEVGGPELRGAELAEVVDALLEDDDLPAGARQHVGGDAPARAGADDDRLRSHAAPSTGPPRAGRSRPPGAGTPPSGR